MSGPAVAPGPFAAPGLVLCRFCGSGPALKAKARGHRGIILAMQFRRVDGPFCRNCGLAVTRQLTADTLVQGWWGLASFLITPAVLLLNVILLIRLGSLSAAYPASARTADPGPALLRRWQMVGLLIPVLIIFFLELSAHR